MTAVRLGLAVGRGRQRPGSPGQAVLVVHSGHDAALQVLARPGAGAPGPTRCSRANGRAPEPGAQQKAGHHRPVRLQGQEARDWELQHTNPSHRPQWPETSRQERRPSWRRHAAEPFPPRQPRLRKGRPTGSPAGPEGPAHRPASRAGASRLDGSPFSSRGNGKTEFRSCPLQFGARSKPELKKKSHKKLLESSQAQFEPGSVPASQEATF